MSMTKEEEKAYMAGGEYAWTRMMMMCLRHLGAHGERTRESLLAELIEARRQLRQLCEDFGDNNFDDELHLGDAIEKHLGRHLYGGDIDAIQSKIKRALNDD